MDLGFTPHDEEYRARLVAWLDENLASDTVASLSADPAGFLTSAQAWQRSLYEAGYVGLAWPREYGGQEATLTEQLIVADELARRRAPLLIGTIGLDILAPTLIRHGSEEQKRRFLPRILTADDLWCQGFSEPEAGSDLASLRTRAVLDGDTFVVTGQKVWTSMGPIADWIFLLVRTDPDASKREGISFLLCDLRTPGIEVRPLRNAGGGFHFSEVFLDEVRVPRGNLVGELHGGWPIVRSTLDAERSGLSGVTGLGSTLQRLWHHAGRVTRDGAPARADLSLRRELAQRWIELEGLRYLGYRTLSAQLHGRDPGSESAVGKLFNSEYRQRLARTALRVEGPAAQLARSSASREHGRWFSRYWDALGYGIGGGTSEIMRNTIAEKVLGLPRSFED